MIRCIATDMDGTLLTSKHVVSLENAEAIRFAQSRGIEVIVATGRSYQEAIYVLKEANLHCPIICVNGAEVRSVEGEKQYSVPLQYKEIEQIVKVLDELEIYFEVYTDRGTYSKDYDKAISTIVDIFMSANPKQDYEQAIQGAKERFDKGMIKLIESYDCLFQDEGIEVCKLLAFSLDREKLSKGQSVIANIEGVAVSSSGFENLEITHVEAQKGTALAKFVEKKGISLSDTMAIGDNYNDVSMFKCVGRAVAMGNAPEGVKGFSHFVTEINDKNGVAKAILDAIQSASS